jgi:hypothetical protein
MRVVRIAVAATTLAIIGIIGAARARGDQAPASGALTGQVRFEGAAPKPRPVRMEADPLCVPVGRGVVFETLQVDGKGGLKDAFVYVKDGLRGRTFPAPKTPVQLDQKGCRYDPHVFGVQVGQPVLISNSDPAVHNVNAQSKVNPRFNLIQPKGTPRSTRTFSKPEIMVPIRCDVHPWMGSWIGVLEHPFFSVSRADGAFEIKGLPPGSYTIEAWHEELGIQTQKVTVDGKKPATATFTFKGKK